MNKTKSSFRSFGIHADGGGIPGGEWQTSFHFKLDRDSLRITFDSIGLDRYTRRWSRSLRGKTAWRTALDFAIRLDDCYRLPIEVLYDGSVTLTGWKHWRAHLIALALFRDHRGEESMYGKELRSMSDATAAALWREFGTFLRSPEDSDGVPALIDRWKSLKEEDEISGMRMLKSKKLEDLLVRWEYGRQQTRAHEVLNLAEMQYERDVEAEIEGEPDRERAILGYSIADVVERVTPKARTMFEAMGGATAVWQHEIRTFLKGLLARHRKLPLEVKDIPGVGLVDFRVMEEDSESSGGFR